MKISDVSSTSDVHQTSNSSNALEAADFLKQQQLQLAASARAVNTDQKVAQDYDFSVHANSIMKLGNSVHNSAGVQHGGAMQAIADKPPAPEPTLTDDAKKQFQDAIATATRQINSGLVRHKQLEPLDSVQAESLKKATKNVTELKNDVSHLLQFEEMRDGSECTKKAAGELMASFAKALTALQLQLQYAQNIVQQYTVKV